MADDTPTPEPATTPTDTENDAPRQRPKRAPRPLYDGPWPRSRHVPPPVETRFRPGNASPAGKPVTRLRDVRKALRARGGHKIYAQGILELAQGEGGATPSVRLSALVELGARLFGKPEQAVRLETDATTDALEHARLQALAALVAARLGPQAPQPQPIVDVTPAPPALPDALPDDGE